MIRALTAFFTAAAGLLKILPLWWIRQEERNREEIEDEMLRLGDRSTPADKLRLEVLAQRKWRSDQSIRSLRSAIGDADPG